jgi:hypothetical protein
MSTSLTLQSTVTRNNEDYICSSVGNETVIMNIKTGKYIGINSIGTVIWKLLEQQLQVSNIITSLIDTYDISAAECESQLLQYLEELLNEKLIRLIS